METSQNQESTIGDGAASGMMPVAIKEKFSIAFGLGGQNILFGFVSAFFMFYLTDILGIGMATAGIILAVVSVIDAINDPIMGIIADRTRTRWGKFRPYLFIGPILIGLFTVLLFTDMNLSPMATVIIVCLAYIGFDLAYTLCDIPIWALPSVMHDSPKEKTSIITWANYGATFGAVLVTILGIQVVLAFGGERDPNAYFMTAIVTSVLAAITMITTGILTRERIKPSAKAIPFLKNLKTVYKNKPLLILLLSVICVTLTLNIRSGIQVYYAIHVAEDPNFMTYAGLMLVVGVVIGLGITPLLMKKFYKKHIFIVACAYSIVMSTIPLFIGYGNVTATIILIGFGFVATGVFNNLIPNLLMDCIDYSEDKLGFRGEGIVFSTRTFITKFCTAISRAIIGLSLAFLGYIEGGVQTSYVVNGLHMLMFLLPTILVALAIVPMAFYSFTEEKRDIMLKGLIARRK